jgi:hypothetical protein
MADLEEVTPSKRARKPAQHLHMAKYDNDDTGSDGEDSTADPAYAPEDSEFIDYNGDADKYELPEAY